MFKECRHILSSGVRCHAAALRDQYFCYFHANLRRSAAVPPADKPFDLKLPPLEDKGAIQLALTQVISALAASRIDTRRAGLLLYGLQIAAQVTPAVPDVEAKDLVREVSSEPDQQALAPAEDICEPPQDCKECSLESTCEKALPFRTLREQMAEAWEADKKWLADMFNDARRKERESVLREQAASQFPIRPAAQSSSPSTGSDPKPELTASFPGLLPSLRACASSPTRKCAHAHPRKDRLQSDAQLPCLKCVLKGPASAAPIRRPEHPPLCAAILPHDARVPCRPVHKDRFSVDEVALDRSEFAAVGGN